MLPERMRELLTAYVDGELSARRHRHVLRLLRHSAEARRLLQRLQTDSRELQNLPYPRLDRDLSGDVLQKVAARRLKAARRPIVRRFPAAYPAWIGTAAAAAVLFLIGTASYFYFAASLDRPARPSPSTKTKTAVRPPPPKTRGRSFGPPSRPYRRPPAPATRRTPIRRLTSRRRMWLITSRRTQPRR